MRERGKAAPGRFYAPSHPGRGVSRIANAVHLIRGLENHRAGAHGPELAVDQSFDLRQSRDVAF